ncbi:MAG: hypothetical protein UY03_C0048G0003 [Parcubacteria group bacterium GW2011_GWA2_47_64]|nr:MAG: hypothetical protein UY03_C0048G0003 [Parcubacteria group bacterium GW2011_GWA2_47_64]
METMGTPKSKAEVEEVLSEAKSYSFEDAEREIDDLRAKVLQEEVKLLRADLYDLRPQLKYLTNTPELGSLYLKPYAVVIEAQKYQKALIITRDDGKLQEFDPNPSFGGKVVEPISPESAIRLYGFDAIREGLVNIFLRKRDDMVVRAAKLTQRLERLQQSQAFLKAQ